MALQILYENEYGVLIKRIYPNHKEFINEIENKQINILPYKCKKCFFDDKSYTFTSVNDVYEHCLSL